MFNDRELRYRLTFCLSYCRIGRIHGNSRTYWTNNFPGIKKKSLSATNPFIFSKPSFIAESRRAFQATNKIFKKISLREIFSLCLK